MAKRYTDEFRRDAVRMATTSGLTRPQLSSDLGVGLSTLNKWVQQHQHDDLMSGPHEDVEKENTRLRKEVRLLREEREVLKNRSGLALQHVTLCPAMSRKKLFLFKHHFQLQLTIGTR
jgi:transposase